MSDWDNFWNGVGDAVDEAVDWVGDAVDDVGEVLEDVGEAIVEVVEDVGEAVVDAAETLVDWTLTAADTMIFDPVDFITGGAVDVDYENGQLTADLNLGIGSVGISVGEQGFDAHAGFDIGIASGEMSYDSDAGFAASGSIGVAWGPLPYAEGHLTIGNDGAISIGGEVQATLPLPFGSSIGFEASGEMHAGRDGFGATSLVDVFVDGPGDTGASFHNDSSVQLDAGGFDASSTTDIVIDGPRGTGAEAHSDSSLHVGADGLLADTDFDAAITGPGGESASTNAQAGFSLGTPGGGAMPVIELSAGLAAGDQSVDLSFANSVGDLAGSGDLSDALSSGATDVDAVVQLLESNSLDEFTSDLVSSEVIESAADGVWDDVGQ